MRRALLTAALVLITATAQAQFELQDSHTNASLRGIHSIGNGIAWASGTEGTVLRTTDDGKTWQHCTTPPEADKLDFRGIQAFDLNTAIVMSSGKGDLSRLYKTTDACKSWKLVFTNPDKEGFWDAVKFVNPENGLILGDPVDSHFQLWRTRNSGESWSSKEDSLVQTKWIDDPFTQSAFAASNSSLTFFSVDAWSTIRFGTGGAAGAKEYLIERSPTATGYGGGGSRYNVPIGDKTASSGIFSLYVLSQEGHFDIVVAVGGDYKQPERPANTAAYSAGGRWHPAQTPPHGYRSSVAYDAPTKTWITTGPNGTDISRDDGRNWSALSPSAEDAPDADKNWNALSLPFVVGPKGRIGRLRPNSLKP